MVAILVTLGSLSVFAVPVSGAATSSSSSSAVCIAHRPLYIPGKFYVDYSAGCSGHDEPELDPVSNLPGSAKDLTWVAVLPKDGSVLVSTLGPTFWFGGTVNDPNSLFGQAFVELQFYADGVVTACNPNGGFVLTFSENSYTVCSPVWKIITTKSGNLREVAAFNAMLMNGNSNTPLVMHAGDLITVHWYTTPAKDGFHVTVTDMSQGGASGTIILNSKHDGPLMPSFNAQKIGNALGWGAVDDTPNSFVWEIGHTSDFNHPAGQFCVPGQTKCFSYDARAWAGTLPIQILGVYFKDGSFSQEYAVVSDFGGKAEVNQFCGHYGGPFCIYPWYTLSATGFHYGVDYPGTLENFGNANQFQQNLDCGGPFGPNSTYCDTVIVN